MNQTEIIKFKRDTSFRQELFTPESFAHPAKLDSQLLLWIVERYTSPGETILDPMFGSGTAMLACTLGRNVVGVELEEKFVRMAQANWEKVRQRPQLGSTMGTCKIIHGDARNLTGLLADKIITSPPYANRLSDNAVDDGDPQRMSYRQALSKFDSVITSPPYEGSLSQDAHSPVADKIFREKGLGVYTDKIDHIVTSPPYEDSQATKDENFVENHTTGGKLSTHLMTADNIGNLKSESYLEAMSLVYQECFKVLKPGGLLIIITKNFIRDQKEIRLDMDTIKLCEQAGFTFKERWYRELPAQSFWRILYKKKYPDAPELKYEDVIILVKA